MKMPITSLALYPSRPLDPYSTMCHWFGRRNGKGNKYRIAKYLGRVGTVCSPEKRLQKQTPLWPRSLLPVATSLWPTDSREIPKNLGSSMGSTWNKQVLSIFVGKESEDWVVSEAYQCPHGKWRGTCYQHLGAI